MSEPRMVVVALSDGWTGVCSEHGPLAMWWSSPVFAGFDVLGHAAHHHQRQEQPVSSRRAKSRHTGPVCGWATCEPPAPAALILTATRPCGHTIRTIPTCARHASEYAEQDAPTPTRCPECGELASVHISIPNQ